LVRDVLNNNYSAILKKAKNMFPDFVIDSENKESFKKIAIYVSEYSYQNINSKRGILLFGPKGTGKTVAMKIIQKCCLKTNNKFYLYSSLDLSEYFATGGDEGKYTSAIDLTGKKNHCIDDLGLERNKVMYFGNEICPAAYVIARRYDLFCRYGIKTHITTNLNFEEIEKIYGDRISDRLKEMCNIIEFKGISRRV
jgi:DNA replication protein DnaC